MEWDCICCFKKYKCIFLCCSFRCIHIKPRRKGSSKIKVKKVNWDKVYTKKYKITRP